jgi:hypothetical protein
MLTFRIYTPSITSSKTNAPLSFVISALTRVLLSVFINATLAPAITAVSSFITPVTLACFAYNEEKEVSTRRTKNNEYRINRFYTSNVSALYKYAFTYVGGFAFFNTTPNGGFIATIAVLDVKM